MFCQPEHIVSYAAEVFDRLTDSDWMRGLDEESFICAAADVLGDLNALHPFREGNGRSQRAFIELLSDDAGHPIVWPADLEQRNIQASIASRRCDNAGLQELIAEGLRPPDLPGADAGPAGTQIGDPSFPHARRPFTS